MKIIIKIDLPKLSSITLNDGAFKGNSNTIENNKLRMKSKYYY